MKRGIVVSRGEEKLKKLFDFFYERYTLRILPFMYVGAELPTSEEIYDMLQLDAIAGEKVCVQGGSFMPEAQAMSERLDTIYEVIRRAGGLETIQKVFQVYKRHNKVNYGILEDFCNVGQVPELPSIDAICEKRSMAPKTIYDRRRNALYDIAAMIERQRLCGGVTAKH